MGLKDLVIPTRTIQYRDQTFEVRGISITDVMSAAKDYGPQLSMVFAQLQRGEVETNDVKAAVMSLSSEFAEVLAAIICMAGDAYNDTTMEVVKRLPVTVQAEALEAIFNETFVSEADVKKLVESLTRMIAAGSGALGGMNGQPSLSGTGDSVAH